jgi:hypothetical protein
MRQLTPPSVFALFLSLFYVQNAYGQATDALLYSYQDAIENNVSANADAGFDYDTQFEYLQDYIRKPLNINLATALDLQKLRLLSDEQTYEIIAHRLSHGKFMDLFELQAALPLIPIRKILPFIYADAEQTDFQIPINQWFSKGENHFFMRFERRLEQAKGYKKTEKEGGFLGDAHKIYTRFRYNYGARLSYGFTLEKDAGERFNKGNFDYKSFHFQISDAHKTFKTIVLGDFGVSLGQGLIHENGFSISKSVLVLNVEKDASVLRPYTSANEANFLRGVATTLKINKNTEGSIFLSYRRRDANLLNGVQKINSLNVETVVSALQFSGLHRTLTEIEDKNAIGLITFGGSVQHKFKRFKLGFNAVLNQFDGLILPIDKLYNLNVFKGKQLINASLNYKFKYKNFNVFGETALSDNGGFATLNGALFQVDKRLTYSVLHRFFSEKYQALNAQPFAESNRTQDENGFYCGLEFKPNRIWTAEMYADMWSYKWLKFGIDAPSFGREFFSKISFKYRNTEGYVQFKNKLKQENTTRLNNAKTNELADKKRTQIRFQFNQSINKNLELRNRLEFAFYEDKNAPSTGFAIWQDVIFKFEKWPLSISSRLAIFDTKDYNSAIYAYENDVFQNFTVLPYYLKGTRFYLNATYRINKNNYLEARFARTFLTNKNTIGSGLDEIEGNKRTDIKLQFRTSF